MNYNFTTNEEMHAFATRLFPICRSITGEGVRYTLGQIKEKLPNLQLFEVPTGTKVFDWEIPKEWNLSRAYVKDPDGKVILDTDVNNLHILNYSIPYKGMVDLETLKDHLFTLEKYPDAIPYVTSYYKERWGFCMSFSDYQTLKPGNYEVNIESRLEKGSLTYAELYLPGETEEEIFFSTYICHPSMANNELSGPVLVTYLAQWLSQQASRRYSYRFVFVPETIGAITYLSKNYEKLKQNVIAGFNVTCVGDERTYSFLPSRKGDTISDKAIQHVLKHVFPDYKTYSFLQRGSDERQYCHPGIDLPVATLMRSKYGEYPEYHTSKDDLSLITQKGLADSLQAYMYLVELLENNYYYHSTHLCEPQLGKRGLYPTLSNNVYPIDSLRMIDILAYADGNVDLLTLAELTKIPSWEIIPLVNTLLKHNLLTKLDKLTDRES